MTKEKLTLKETQLAISKLKTLFSNKLAKKLNLHRVSAPLFVLKKTGLNDTLNGERPVSFTIKDLDGEIEIVHSLAKWKRNALKKYEFSVYEGLYADMNAIRKEEDLDEFHSLYVDQWDWELIIKESDRNISFLKKIVKKIYNCLLYTEKEINKIYPQLSNKLSKQIFFITAKDLYKKYPTLTPKERENEIVKEKGSVFIIEIGNKLKDGNPHSSRAKDYDDWTLNGDLIVYDKLHNCAMELSSMGIRVNKDAIIKQYGTNENEISLLSKYHKNIIDNALPFTIGGGIGQSRIAMLLLEKQHIGEAQVSVWDDKNYENAKKMGIKFL